MKEDVLVERILAGEKALFGQLMNPYQNILLGIAYRMTGDAEDAKEICQEAVMKTFKYLKAFKRGSSFKNWVCRIVVNESSDFLRSKRRQQQIIFAHIQDSVLKETQTPEDVLSLHEIKMALRDCLFVLTPKERSVYLLRDGEGHSIKETAEILGYSSSSIRTHLCRARQKIRIQLEKKYLLETRRHSP